MRLYLALLIGSLFYRFVLGYFLFTEPVTPFAFIADHHRVFASLRSFTLDMLFATSVSLLVWGLEVASTRWLPAGDVVSPSQSVFRSHCWSG